MIYQRYFKTGQRILLTTLGSAVDPHRTELLSAYVDGGDKENYILTLPYCDDAVEQYPFTEGMKFELSSEVLGLGVRVTGAFVKKVDQKRICLKINSDLQMFQRRSTPRFDLKVGIRFTRGQGVMKALRQTWEKNIEILRSPEAPLIFEGFKPCSVNLSSGGIRFALHPPAEPDELCLILIKLEDGDVPICALAEIIWARPEKDETVMVCGMRFINILAEDQQRIDTYIRQQTGAH